MHTLKEHMTRLDKAMADLTKTVERTEATVERTSQTVDRTSRSVDDLSVRMKESFARSDKAQEKRDLEWGRLANKMGTLVEDIVAPGIPEIFHRMFGLQRLEFSAQRVRRAHRLDAGRMHEFDYVVMAGDVVLVNETKSTLRPEDIPSFVEALRDIRNYLPEAEGRTVVGCLASFSLDPTLVTAGERQGLLMLGLGTGLMRVLNSPGFVPRWF